MGFLTVDHFHREEGFEFQQGDKAGYKKKYKAVCASKYLDGHEIMLVKPQTFMNRSGRAVRAVLADLAAELLEPSENVEGSIHPDRVDQDAGDGNLVRPSRGGPDSIERGPKGAGRQLDLREHLLVISDDFALSEGKLRFRGRGSAGGHNGLASIIAALGTELFGRLRVGIGGADERDSEGNGDGEEDWGSNRAADYVLEPLDGKDQDRLTRIAAHAANTLNTWIKHDIVTCANRFNGAEGELPPETK